MEVPPVRYTHNGDVCLAYQVFGDGPVDLLFVTGFVWHAELVWDHPPIRRVFERLGSFARVAVFDKRGQGLSDRPERTTTLEEVAADALAVMDAAGFERPAVLGVSEGGPAATLLAAAHPSRVSTLVLLVPNGARIVKAEDYDAGVAPEILDALLAQWTAEWGGPVALELFAQDEAGDARLRSFWARLLRNGVSVAGLRRLVDTWREQDVRQVLPAVGVPTLVIARDQDLLVPSAATAVLADMIPGARLVETPGSHLFFAGDIEPWLEEVEEFLTGERHAPEPDRVLATVLFTDIVESTETAGRLGDARWRELLAEHDDIVRRELDRHRGREVKHTGDGFLASFDGPARGIRCAGAIRDAVRQAGIEIRAGLHTGECEARGDDLAGMAVHIGARVAARAGPSEVLVSGTVRDLVVGSGLPLEDRGLHALKGVDGEWRIFALGR